MKTEKKWSTLSKVFLTNVKNAFQFAFYAISDAISSDFV